MSIDGTKIQAIGEYVLIQKDSEVKMTASGFIYELQEKKHYFITGVVLSVGDEVKIPIQIGDKVLAQRVESVPVRLTDTDNKEEFQFVNYKYVFGKYCE